MGLQQTSDCANITVCKNRYSKLYMEINPMKCASCNSWPKKGITFTHHSPNCELVSQYLNDSTCISITPNDLLCQSCYEIPLSQQPIMNTLNNDPHLSPIPQSARPCTMMLYCLLLLGQNLLLTSSTLVRQLF